MWWFLHLDCGAAWGTTSREGNALLLTHFHPDSVAALCSSSSKRDSSITLPTLFSAPWAQRCHQNSMCQMPSGLYSHLVLLPLIFQTLPSLLQYLLSHSVLFKSNLPVMYTFPIPLVRSQAQTTQFILITRNTVPPSFFVLLIIGTVAITSQILATQTLTKLCDRRACCALSKWYF